MQELLGRKIRPDAVFCYNDLSAIGAMQATMDAGLRIPHDIAFVGCGNLRCAPYLKVPLTSNRSGDGPNGRGRNQAGDELARNPDLQPQVRLLQPTLVVRQFSVAR
jgi:LacI family transcriptional regulator